jgi:hypothetical protein
MGVFNDDIISLPEINADQIKEAADDFIFNPHKTHEELMEIINDIVHGIYYSCKAGAGPKDLTWRFEGKIFGIPQAYASGPVWQVPPPSWEKTMLKVEQTIEYIENVFTELGFEFEYVKCDKRDNEKSINTVVIRIPFKTKDFKTFAQNVSAKTIGFNLVSTPAMSMPEGQLFFLNLINGPSN